MATSSPRPFYVIGHNTNTLNEVGAALAAGANAIEPDIQVTIEGQLVVHHDPVVPGVYPITVESFFQQLNFLLEARPDWKKQLSLVMLDSKVSDRHLGRALVNLVRTYLTDPKVAVLYNVGSADMVSFFDDIHANLRPNEGLIVDGDDDPVKIRKYFLDLKPPVVNNCYGDGYFKNAWDDVSHLAVEHGTMLKAVSGNPKWVYTWVLAAWESMREHVRIGLDGAIVDDVEALVAVVHEPEFAGQVRMAVPGDNPFDVTGPAYGLAVHTYDRGDAGTNANLTFVVHGDRGSVTKTVAARWAGRFEAGTINYVSMLGADIGTPTSVTVSSDGRGDAADWFLDYIIVEGRWFHGKRCATFQQWIVANQAETRKLETTHYALTVQTAPVSWGGTDSNVRFILKGDNATATWLVTGAAGSRFESGQVDVIGMYGPEVGRFQSITVRTDDQGSAPGWFLSTIALPETGSTTPRTFFFNQWIYPRQAITRTPADVNYRLLVNTGDVGWGGTDSNISFTVKGDKGSVSQMVDAATGFEAGDHNVVIVKGMDIGTCTSLTVGHDSSGSGPDWYVDSIGVEKNGHVVKTYVLGRWIGAGSPVTVH